MLKSFQLSRPLPAAPPVRPTYHCLQAGGVHSLIGLHFKTFLMSTNKLLQGQSVNCKTCIQSHCSAAYIYFNYNVLQLMLCLKSPPHSLIHYPLNTLLCSNH